MGIKLAVLTARTFIYGIKIAVFTAQTFTDKLNSALLRAQTRIVIMELALPGAPQHKQL